MIKTQRAGGIYSTSGTPVYVGYSRVPRALPCTSGTPVPQRLLPTTSPASRVHAIIAFILAALTRPPSHQDHDTRVRAVHTYYNVGTLGRVKAAVPRLLLEDDGRAKDSA